METKNEAIEYTKSLEYLPDFMRDFHDQKDIFKAIFELYKSNESLQKMNVNWVDAHIFTIDYFLWFMGQHGYKLQKVRKKGIEFYNLKETIEEMINRRNKPFIELLKGSTTNEHTTGND
jgi:hypothetical protein